MINGKKLAEAGFSYLGVSYGKMDCQAFVEQCLRDCGLKMNLAGSNAWFREVKKNGAILTPEECVQRLGTVPAGAYLFILKQDGGEPAKYRPDGLGNASHIGIVTGRGEGAIHSSSSRGCVAESKFRNKSISGGWNRVGLWNRVAYDYGDTGNGSKEPAPTEQTPATRPTLRKGSRGDAVKEMQGKLLLLGYDLGSCGADGIFGKKTLAAVKAFQRDSNLKTDGICGRLTWSALLEHTAPVSS